MSAVPSHEEILAKDDVFGEVDRRRGHLRLVLGNVATEAVDDQEGIITTDLSGERIEDAVDDDDLRAADDEAKKALQDELFDEATKEKPHARNIKTEIEPGLHFDSSVSQLLYTMRRNSKRRPLLKSREELELARRIERGDLQAKDTLIESNLRLAVYIASDYRNENRHLKFGDVIGWAFVGLIRAVEKFDYRRGNRFSTYATPQIKAAIQRAFENTDRHIRIPVNQERILKSTLATETALVAKLGRKPSNEEIAAELGVSLGELALLQGTKSTAWLDQENDSDQSDNPGGATLGHTVATYDTYDSLQGEHDDESELSPTFHDALNNLPHTHRRVFEERVIHGDTSRETLIALSKELGIAQKKITGIEKEALDLLAGDPALVSFR